MPGRSSNIDPALRHYTITPSADPLEPRPVAIRVDGDGTATIVDEEGTAIEYNVLQGELLRIQAVKVTAATATLIALY